jgi:predicted Rossmann-fold nucleotide-binding protein
MTAAKLYTIEDLLAGLDPKGKMSYLTTFDFRQFAGFVRAGGSAPRDLQDRLAQTTHDAGIAQGLQDYILIGKPLVGIMGSHSTARSDASFRMTADLCRRLSREGFLIATGGGPGAMEAGHFGAWFANASDGAYEAGLAEIGTVPRIPNFDGLLDDAGVMVPGKEPVVEQAHDWLMAALRARDLVDADPGESVAIATWLYGAEPTMPFATAYAKYFQNSIREEALVHGASAGIVYARGGGGTIREIFQDVEQNYYARSVAEFTPMIFVDPDGYWSRDATFENGDLEHGKVQTKGLKLDEQMRKIFALSLNEAMRPECLAKVRFTTDFDEIVAILRAHMPAATHFMSLLAKGVDSRLLSGRFSR